MRRPFERYDVVCSDVSMLRGGSRLNSESKFRFRTLGFYFEPEIVTLRKLLVSLC
jgi:hypothetical protein